MAGKKRKKSTGSPLWHGPSLLIIASGLVFGMLVLILIVHNAVAY